MSLLEHAPHFEVRAAVEIARDLFGLTAVASPLPSERDQNFLLQTSADERCVLKIANAAEARALLEAENAAMDHVAPLRLCPRVRSSVHGNRIERLASGHCVRMLTWLPGVPLGTLPEHPPALLQDLGRRLGELDAAFTSFDHPAVHRDFHWDLANGFRVVREHSSRVNDRELRALVEGVAEQVEANDGARLRQLRRSTIHGDVNDYNVLVGKAPDSAADRVVGLVDFGDLVHSYTIADLAIAIAYAVLDKRDPLEAAGSIACGYHRARLIEPEELAALFGLVKLRLCVSVCLAAYQRPARPSDAYLAVSQEPIRRTLPVLAAIEPAVAEDELGKCRMKNEQ